MLTAVAPIGSTPPVPIPHRATAPSAPAALLLASGTAPLICQLLWIGQLPLMVDVEVHALTLAPAAFFASLALGGWWLGCLPFLLEGLPALLMDGALSATAPAGAPSSARCCRRTAPPPITAGSSDRIHHESA